MSGTSTASGDTLWGRRYGPFAAAAVALVALGALENRATWTVIPTVVGELDALGWFGAVVTMPGLFYIVAAPLTGVLSDRRGPGWPLLAGMVAFVGGSLVCATAPGIAVLVAGRAATGVAEAMFDIALTVMVARQIPERLRPRLFAAYSMAWLLPSVLGPQVAAAVATTFGWRWVFVCSAAALIPIAAVLCPLAWRQRHTSGLESDPHVTDDPGHQLGPTLGAFALMIAITALTPAREHHLLGVAPALLAAAGLGAGAVAVTLALNPAGVARLATGLPATIGLATMMSVAFGVAAGFLPLYAQVSRGLSPAEAGTVMTVTGIFWALGAWFQSLDRVQATVSPATRTRACFALIAAGLGSVALLATDAPLWVPYLGWAMAGMGIGCGSATLTHVRITQTPIQLQGRYGAGANLLSAAASSSITLTLSLAMAGRTHVDIARGGALTAIALAVLCAIGLTLSTRITTPTNSEDA